MGIKAHPMMPRVNVVGAREAREYGHVCGKCRQPITNKGRPDCPNAPVPTLEQTLPESRWPDDAA